MRYKIDDDKKDEDPEKEAKEFLRTLKCVPDLPMEMQVVVGDHAEMMSRSFQKQTDKLAEDGELNKEDGLSAILTPFLLELSFLKIQLAAACTSINEIQAKKDG
jgi:hypothetical protein